MVNPIQRREKERRRKRSNPFHRIYSAGVKCFFNRGDSSSESGPEIPHHQEDTELQTVEATSSSQGYNPQAALDRQAGFIWAFPNADSSVPSDDQPRNFGSVNPQASPSVCKLKRSGAIRGRSKTVSVSESARTPTVQAPSPTESTPRGISGLGEHLSHLHNNSPTSAPATNNPKGSFDPPKLTGSHSSLPRLPPRIHPKQTSSQDRILSSLARSASPVRFNSEDAYQWVGQEAKERRAIESSKRKPRLRSERDPKHTGGRSRRKGASLGSSSKAIETSRLSSFGSSNPDIAPNSKFRSPSLPLHPGRLHLHHKDTLPSTSAVIPKPLPLPPSRASPAILETPIHERARFQTPRIVIQAPSPAFESRNASFSSSYPKSTHGSDNSTDNSFAETNKSSSLGLADKMSRASLMPLSGPAVYKQRAIQEAKQQQAVIEERLNKQGIAPTDYAFDELIGKGAYGRVYKSHHKETKAIVAIKVLETDEMDFAARASEKDGGMQDALKEIDVLQRLKQSNAVNVNIFHEAFQVHSQLWIVSEYCPGGSLTTLRRATSNRLTERHIVAIARELAAGLKSVHAAGIIHRDIKCSNVMISENGNLQIIDFGVAGILLSNLDQDKRRTVIGTPHWMAPEMQKNTSEIPHGTEVDVWAYGITLYECATGAPPNARTLPGRELKSRIRQQPAPRLSDDRFSPELHELVAYVLESDPMKRPSMSDISSHKFIKHTENTNPTSSLRELVENYYRWERAGGQRASLFMQGGAAQPKFQDEQDDNEEWTFSTTAGFDRMHDDGVFDLDTEFHLGAPNNMLSSSPPCEIDELDLSMSHTIRPGDATNADKANLRTKKAADTENETRIMRGGQKLAGLFDANADPYKFDPQQPKSDLPLRSGNSSSRVHSMEVSVTGNGDATPQINLDRVRDIKRNTMAWKWGDNLAKPVAEETAVAPSSTNRNTMAWKWGENLPKPLADDNVSAFSTNVTPPRRPHLQHAATTSAIERPISETLDLDDLMNMQRPVARPVSDTLDLDDLMGDFGSSSFTVAPSPFPVTPSPFSAASSGSTMALGSPADGEEYNIDSTMRARPQITPPSRSPLRAPAILPSAMPPPVNPAALVNDAPPQTVLDALETGLQGLLGALDALLPGFADDDEEGDGSQMMGEDDGYEGEEGDEGDDE